MSCSSVGSASDVWDVCVCVVCGVCVGRVCVGRVCAGRVCVLRALVLMSELTICVGMWYGGFFYEIQCGNGRLYVLNA